VADEIDYLSGGVELLDAMGPLWEKLNALHAIVSPHFADSFRKGSFGMRKAHLLDKSKTAQLRVDIAQEHGSPRLVGYCVSTVDTEGTGEIDSLFVEENCRGRGIGGRLMQAALSWMNERGAKKKHLAVAFGNTAALGFYERFGFYPRNIELVQRSPT
jgi:ribosomal protein S18 acetylase RimI-like enzyme